MSAPEYLKSTVRINPGNAFPQRETCGVVVDSYSQFSVYRFAETQDLPFVVRRFEN